MSENEFLRQKQAAMQIMREMNSRSGNNNTNKNTQNLPHPPPTKLPQTNKAQQQKSQSGFDLPFADLLKNGDTALILGLLLILFSENADKRLLFALIYILL